MDSRQFLLALYPPLAFVISAAAGVLFIRVTAPAIRGGSVSKYLIGVGGTIISFGLLVEVWLYGLARWFPSLAWLSDLFLVAAAAKICLLLGHAMILASVVKPERRLLLLGWLCVALWTIWFVALLVVLRG